LEDEKEEKERDRVTVSPCQWRGKISKLMEIGGHHLTGTFEIICTFSGYLTLAVSRSRSRCIFCIITGFFFNF
jgi:hypothetical protein